MPAMRAIQAGRFEATCAWCLRPSVAVPAASLEAAWEWLKRIGWTWRAGKYGGSGGAACVSCSQNPGTEEDAVARARRRRKTKR